MSGNARDRRLRRRQVLRAAAQSTPTMPRRQEAFISAPVVITASAAAAGQSPRHPRIDIVAYNGGELLVDGIDLPVVLDYAGAMIPATLPLNVDHCQDIGSLLGQGATSLSGSSLTISGTITASNPQAAEVVRMATQEGFKWQASVKAIITNSRRIAPGQQVQINGRTFTGPIIHAIESQLTHCAVLGEGADQTSSVSIAAKAAKVLKGQSIMTFEEWLASIQVDQATLSAGALAALQAQYNVTYPAAQASAAVAPVAPAPAPVAQVAAAASATQSPAVLLAAQRKAEADETRRVGAIRAKAREFPLIAAKAIEEGWDEHRVELEVLKAGRATGPTHQAPNAPPQPLVLEAAMAVSRKIPGHEKQYPDQVLQAAHSQFRGRIGLQQVVLIAACANGYRLDPGSRISVANLKNVLRHAFRDQDEQPQVLQAAFSTVSLPGVFANVANKELLAGYAEEDQTWREVMAIKSVSDFKAVTSYRLLDNMEYEELSPAGEIRHGTVGEESYTRSADTFAKMFVLSRKNIINDDLGAFDDLRTRIGRGAAKKLNRLAWTKWLANSAFFTAGRGNYITGATTTLLTDGVGLGLALDAFDAMRTPAADGAKVPGGLVGGSPSILLTPGGGIARNAELLYGNSNLGAGTANSEANLFAGRYKPVKSVFLNDPTISGYSATGWYLLRDPQAGAAVVVSFLDGVETPTVESADADFNTLGIQFRGYHDFGVDQTSDYLCGVKSKGAA